ncbi:hypothetical protein LOZ80_21130 [Paenibacillus sp. HWE-109]|uniref:golvesin C-terminal-like domain-containing protein n=1 Tax=Paenibacillus sp. HWE-109 TaxID=1306526 RepID=UPI001EDFAE8B|nr:cellulase N-terminal Ig-like domain-containing protein [Paenibacillus sp. HWE-109]UKS24135.1 hypothetical protein LOZ80_21130 [Paenibacillus sp. HWE-109]
MGSTIIIDCWDKACFIQGEWFLSKLRGNREQDTIYSNTAGNSLFFVPAFEKAGLYKVSVYTIKAGGEQHYEIRHNGACDWAASSPSAGESGWVELGTYWFRADGSEYVKLISQDGCTRGTSIMLEFTEGTKALANSRSFITKRSAIEGVSSPAYFEIKGEILDCTDAAYTELGDWKDARLENYLEKSITRVSSTLGDSVKWYVTTPNLSAQEEGDFAVYVWMPYGNNSGASVKYTVQTLHGSWIKEIDQEKRYRGGWTKLLTVRAAGDTGLGVTLEVMSERDTYASAVKLVRTDAAEDAPANMMGEADTETVAILVNQSGYDIGRAKRATVVNTPDETPFFIKDAQTNETVYSGEVVNYIADFSKLNPDKKSVYYVESNGAVSYTFTVANHWIQRVSVPPAVAFMNHARNDAWLPGLTSIAWRDSHQFSFELGSLALMYMSNPSLYENMPRNIFQLDQTMFNKLKTQNEPDLIWLMKFAVERYYDLKVNQAHSLHPLIKEQLSYFIYLCPSIKAYVSEEDYIRIRDFTIEEWTSSDQTNTQKWYDIEGEKYNLLEVQTVFGGIKGSFPPAHAIVPNLLMYEVVKRDRLGGEERYLDTAYRNCEYILDHIDIASPYYSKGQRMSEYIVMQNLAYFQEMYPQQAPARLITEINRWAKKMIARSANMWDMRMASSVSAGDEQDYWTGAAYAKANDPRITAIMNEPGSEAGIQAAMFAAARVIDNPQVAGRLKEIGIAGIDHMFGRNPYGRMFFFDAVRDIEGAHSGWFSKHEVAGNGRLGDVPGRIDASPKEMAYPFNPKADPGYVEGWVAFNSAWNCSIAYSAGDEIELMIDRDQAQIGEGVQIRLKAPIHMDSEKVETARVQVTDTISGKMECLCVTKEDQDSMYFIGVYLVPEGAGRLEFSYGYGLFKKLAKVTIVSEL